ncbi:MAG: hypothetical protein KC589_00965 [Nanoarchaeota archaeon]|nr:hypothetical protein [Nanoarchaeota archaeon]
MFGLAKTIKEKDNEEPFQKLMDICLQLNRLNSEFNTKFNLGEYADANESNKKFEVFYIHMTKLVKFNLDLSTSLLNLNAAMYSYLKKFENELISVSDKLPEGKKTQSHFLNQLALLRKTIVSLTRSESLPEGFKKELEELESGIILVDNYFKKMSEELDNIHTSQKKNIDKVESWLKDLNK